MLELHCLIRTSRQHESMVHALDFYFTCMLLLNRYLWRRGQDAGIYFGGSASVAINTYANKFWKEMHVPVADPLYHVHVISAAPKNHCHLIQLSWFMWHQSIMTTQKLPGVSCKSASSFWGIVHTCQIAARSRCCMLHRTSWNHHLCRWGLLEHKVHKQCSYSLPADNGMLPRNKMHAPPARPLLYGILRKKKTENKEVTHRCWSCLLDFKERSQRHMCTEQMLVRDAFFSGACLQVVRQWELISGHADHQWGLQEHPSHAVSSRGAPCTRAAPDGVHEFVVALIVHVAAFVTVAVAFFGMMVGAGWMCGARRLRS